MNEADMDESEESEEEKNFVSGFGTSKTFSNFLESPSAFKAMPFRNTLFEDKKGYANTAGKQRFYSPISPCKPMPMQYNYINSSEKSRPILLGDPKMTNILEVLMEESIEWISPRQQLMPEIIIENSSSEKDIIGLSGEVYKPSAEMIYESKGKKS